MRHLRILLVAALGLGSLPHALGQEAAASQPAASQPAASQPAASQPAASQPASRPETSTYPTSRPAEPRAKHPRIGIKVDAVALEQQRMARVEAVIPGSPAERAGIKVGDIIVKVDGEDIRDDKTFRNVMSRRRPGDTVAIVLRRGSDEMDMAVTLPDKPTRSEPEAVTVQHVLVGFGARAPTPAGQKRTLEEARKLADNIAALAKNGAEFGELVKRFSEDEDSIKKDPPGHYVLVEDAKPKPTPDASTRSGMVQGFSSVSFALNVGDVAIAPADPDLSPFGFHIIKRIK